MRASLRVATSRHSRSAAARIVLHRADKRPPGYHQLVAALEAATELGGDFTKIVLHRADKRPPGYHQLVAALEAATELGGDFTKIKEDGGVAPRHQARKQVPVTFEGGQMPIHMRLPKEDGGVAPRHQARKQVPVTFEGGQMPIHMRLPKSLAMAANTSSPTGGQHSGCRGDPPRRSQR